MNGIILPPGTHEGDEADPVVELADICCGRCKWYLSLKKTPNIGQCRKEPPKPLVVGMFQDALGRPQPTIYGAFPAVRPDIFCGAFERKDVN